MDCNMDRDSGFDDILERDSRYDARAYDFALRCFAGLMRDSGGDGRSAMDIVDRFCDDALDEFGPLAYTVFREWGIEKCADIGEIVANLADAGRIERTWPDDRADYIGAVDLEAELTEPFLP